MARVGFGAARIRRQLAANEINDSAGADRPLAVTKVRALGDGNAASCRYVHDAGLCTDRNYVYRIDPASGRVDVVADDFEKPNVLAFSPDESLLYIADTGTTHGADGPRQVRRFKVSADGQSISSGDVFATCPAGWYYGFRVDVHANLWLSAGDGVHCHSSDGTWLGKIRIPEPLPT